MSNEIITKIYLALIDKYNYTYIALRSELTLSMGYDEFRKHQSEAFKIICSGELPFVFNKYQKQE